VTEPQLPPLSIRHFFYLTFGIAVAIWINLSGLRVQPKTIVEGVSLASRIAGALALGGVIASLPWITGCWLRGRPVSLQDPGSRYVLVDSLMRITAFVGAIVSLLAFNYLRPRDLRTWDQVAPLINIASHSLIAIIAANAMVRVREWTWKIIFVCALITHAIFIFRMFDVWWQLPNYERPSKGVALTWLRIRILLHYIAIVAMASSLIIDGVKKTPRHWLHYFGIVLFALTAIQFLLFQIVGIRILPLFH
jgi:hypothetical protein